MDYYEKLFFERHGILPTNEFNSRGQRLYYKVIYDRYGNTMRKVGTWGYWRFMFKEGYIRVDGYSPHSKLAVSCSIGHAMRQS